MAKNKVIINGIDTSSLKVLSQSEMEHLFRELKSGNKVAKSILTQGNLKLVLSILKKSDFTKKLTESSLISALDAANSLRIVVLYF